MEPIHLQHETDLATGLSPAQAAVATKNLIDSNPQKSIGRLITEEFFSFFNIVNYILAFLVILTGSYRNLLFMIVVLSNTIIGLYQKIHSRRILNQLALVHAQKYQVLRGGKYEDLASDEIVEGDLVKLSAGAQIPCDGVIRTGACQVNESPLTGESDALERDSGQTIYGGCFVVSGHCVMQAALVGNAQYMASIVKEAKREKQFPSQLRDTLNRLIQFCSIIIFPAGLLLFLKLYVFTHSVTLNAALLNVTAAMVGMIPEGLIILTSTALATAAVKMARQAVLIHELYCIESLARVDTLCLDKTGTITSGAMNVYDFVPVEGVSKEEMKVDLANILNALQDDNLTSQAIRKAIEGTNPTQRAIKTFPFSSEWKSSGALFKEEAILMGAYRFLFEDLDPSVLAKIDQWAKQGLRVLVLAKSKPIEKLQKGNYTLCGFLLIEDEIRPNAAKILEYFHQQEVALKVISGDMTATVQAIASKAGVSGQAIDMSTVSQDQIPEVVKKYSIFGRVTPMQKKLMVEALQNQGHTVAMTGDGVNDVMALKQADCSIAMGSGAQAAMAVASMVLLEDQFSALPQILLEGRRVINNIQRTASLFLVKTLFSFFVTVLTVVWMKVYPFVPIQLTLVSSAGIGIPSFFLTFENDTKRPKGNFLISVLSRAIPGALAITFGIVIAYIVLIHGPFELTLDQYQTICTWLAAINALGILALICFPPSRLRLGVIILSIGMMLGALLLLPSVFYLDKLSWPLFAILALIAILEESVLWILWHLQWSKILAAFASLDPGAARQTKISH